MTDAARGHVAMLAFSALVAGSFSLGSMAAPHISPAALNAVRFALAAAVLGAVVFATKGFPRSALQAPWRYFVLAGFFAAYFVLMFEGLKTGAPVSMAAVFTLTPILAAGFGWVLLRQRTTPRMALALTVGALGAVWVIFRADLANLMAFQIGRGEQVYFIGCVAHAIYAPLVKKLNRGESPLVFTFGMLVAGIGLMLVYAWPDLWATEWRTLPPIVWITIVYTAVAASAATFVLLQFAALRLPSAKVMAYTYLTPSWVLAWEVGLGRGVPSPMVLAGILLTLFALFLLLKNDSAA